MSSPQDPSASGRQPTTPVPSVPPAPDDDPRSRWFPRSVPDHIGRARTSTVVLVVLFAALFALWIGVRPDSTDAATTPASPTTGVDQPAIVPPATTTEPAPSSTAAATRSTPRTTTPADTSTEEETTSPAETTPAPTTTRPPTTSGAPSTTAAAPTS